MYPFEPAGPYRPMKRKVALWTFGILAGAIFGSIIGYHLVSSFADTGLTFGMLGGVFTFACARLWWGERSADREP